jgi:RNA polymerase sigma factor (sigma-70 family)
MAVFDGIFIERHRTPDIPQWIRKPRLRPTSGDFIRAWVIACCFSWHKQDLSPWLLIRLHDFWPRLQPKRFYLYISPYRWDEQKGKQPREAVSDEAKERSKHRRNPKKPRLEKLTPAEQGELVRRWRETGDPEIANRLFLSVRWVAVEIARRYPGFDYKEMVNAAFAGETTSEGKHKSGFYYGLERYDPCSGVWLSRWIREPLRWAIAAHVRKQRLYELRQGVPLIDNLDKDDAFAQSKTDLLDERGPTPEILNAARDRLTLSEQAIIEARYSEKPPTYAELGRQFGLSDERIRQKEAAALRKLRRDAEKRGFKCTRQSPKATPRNLPGL